MNAARATAMTEENRQEAARLRKLWDAREVRLSQREFGRAYKMGNQSAVGHFLCGRQPLSLKAAMSFAAGLHCKIEDFSPRLAALIAAAGAVSEPAPKHPSIDWGDLAKPETPTPPDAARPQDMQAYIDMVTSPQQKIEGFAEFMNEPSIRGLARLLPPSDPQDATFLIVKSAFDRGIDRGAYSLAMKLLENK